LEGDQREVVKRDGVAGIQLDDLLEELPSLVVVLLAVGDHPAVEGELGLHRGLRGSGQQPPQHHGKAGSARDHVLETQLPSLPPERSPRAGH
jgi:hypothetical protein